MPALMTPPKPKSQITQAFGRLQNILLFTGRANPHLAQEIAQYLRLSLGKAQVARFADGEVEVKIEDNVRGKDCFVIQPTCPPVNENLMELLVMLDALRRASAGKITAVIPYFGYARADRKTEPRVPITAKLVANLLTSAGATRVIAVDLHAGQIQGFFDIPLDHLFATKVFLEYVSGKNLKDMVVVSPDVGGVERARAFAKRLHAALAFIDKRRPRPNEASVFNVIGDVEGKTAFVIDDIVDTAGTLREVSQALKENGAKHVFAFATHGVLSRDALHRVESSPLEELIITNSIPLSAEAKKSKKIRVLSIAKLLGEAIYRNHVGESISALFI